MARVPRHLLGREAEQISKLTALRIPGSEGITRAAVGVPARALQRPRGRDDHAGGRAGGRGVRPRPRPRAARRADLRARADDDCGRAQRSCSTSSRYIEANLGNPDLAPEQIARAELHLDAVPAQAVRGRGDERVPVDPRRAARPLPARPRRSGARQPDDPGDREPLGAARARSTSAACSGRRTDARPATTGVAAAGRSALREPAAAGARRGLGRHGVSA